MKVPYSWLKDFVEIDVDARTLGDKLVSAGFEIEEFIDLRDKIKNVVVGSVESIEKVEESDHLNVCRINVGAETLQIVTGAQNVRKGDKVPVALDGAVLPDGKTIKTGELRGVLSQGMLCSGEELALTEEDYAGAGTYGILILKDTETVGADMNDVLGIDDVVLDVAITANRPDCNSILGVAREVAAVLNKPLRMPELSYREYDGDINDYIRVDVRDSALCPRYMAKVVVDVQQTQSPKIIRDRLKAVGIRPINNLVDVTNYVLTEIGQPMHAFDLNQLAGKKIVVRTAEKGETITALDGKEYALNASQLVICDAEKPVAIAGVMGGMYSSIGESTNAVALESARFARDSIRHTARDIGLHSDSSARFEKGIDYYSQEIGMERALALFDQYGWGKIVKGVIDVIDAEPKKKTLTYSYKEINAVLGVELNKEDISNILNRLDIKTEEDGDILTSAIPIYREDIFGINDLAEEVIRIYGYDVIKSTLRNSCRGGKTEQQIRLDKIRAVLVGKGAYETISYAFVSPKAFDCLNLRDDSPLRKTVDILNPIGQDVSVMRTTLAYSMIKTIENNFKRGNKAARFFEIGNTYIPKQLPMTELPEEKSKLIICFYGKNENYYTLKSVIDEIFAVLRLSVSYTRASIEYLHPGRSAYVTAQGTTIGYLGEVHPDVTEKFDVDDRLYLAELDAEFMMENAVDFRAYQAISKYQGMERDLALIAPADMPADKLVSLIKGACSSILEKAEVFDVYVGGQIPSGKKSVAVTLTFRDMNRTLKDDEVNAEIQKVLDTLSARSVTLR